MKINCGKKWDQARPEHALDTALNIFTRKSLHEKSISDWLCVARAKIIGGGQPHDVDFAAIETTRLAG